MNWDDPEARLHLLEAVGPEEYSRQLKEFHAANPIRPVSTRFGVLYAVTGTKMAFQTYEEAVRYREGLNG